MGEEPADQDAAIQEPVQWDDEDLDGEIIDIEEEMESWKPVIGVGMVGALIFSMFVLAILRTLGMPSWADPLIMMPVLCSPFIVFGIIVWNKRGVRMPDGQILSQEEARRLSIQGGVEYAGGIVRSAWQLTSAAGWAVMGAARWIRLRLAVRDSER